MTFAVVSSSDFRDRGVLALYIRRDGGLIPVPKRPRYVLETNLFIVENRKTRTTLYQARRKNEVFAQGNASSFTGQ
jgi:hypothetical protein